MRGLVVRCLGVGLVLGLFVLVGGFGFGLLLCCCLLLVKVGLDFGGLVLF